MKLKFPIHLSGGMHKLSSTANAYILVIECIAKTLKKMTRRFLSSSFKYIIITCLISFRGSY